MSYSGTQYKIGIESYLEKKSFMPPSSSYGEQVVWMTELERNLKQPFFFEQAERPIH